MGPQRAQTPPAPRSCARSHVPSIAASRAARKSPPPTARHSGEDSRTYTTVAMGHPAAALPLVVATGFIAHLAIVCIAVVVVATGLIIVIIVKDSIDGSYYPPGKASPTTRSGCRATRTAATRTVSCCIQHDLRLTWGS
jgi:hypothetical protein